MNMYFDDFHPGQHIRTDTRTVTETELDAFLNLADLHLPMFLDDEGAREVGHSRRLVTGPMILAVALGLVRAHGCFDKVVAALEFNHVRFLKAVHPGDTLRVEFTVAETRPTSHPDRGLVILDFSVCNQQGDTVLAMQGTYLFRRSLERSAP
jgi:acyl dehydratase